MLFREQGITIASILTAIGMTISVLVEALLPGGGSGTSAGGKPPPKDEKDLKEWIRNKVKGFSLLLGRLGKKLQQHCLASLEQSSVGSSIKPQM